MAFSSSSSEDNFGDRRYREMPVPGLRNTSDDHGTGRAQSQSRSSSLDFDVLRWYPKHQSCQKYFLDHAQHLPEVQAFAAFINILLPFQREPNPVHSFSRRRNSSRSDERSASSSKSTPPPTTVSLIPYIRRLVVCGMDLPPILQGFFGNDWAAGIGPQREQERRNYLFAAKSRNWGEVKQEYDIPPLETVPFMQPVKDPTDGELHAAEEKWSEWLAMQDWMVGSRAPD
jgi:hypothetical protein